MINWVNFLHIYQPPQQDEKIFHRVARESYFEIAKFFDLYDGLVLTMNVSGCLLEQLIEYRYDKLLEDFVRAFKSGELELVGSAMYHPILPLLPDGEIERQILLDENMKLGIFGSGYRRQGFYLPEMACSRRVLEILDRMGFEWVILDEIAFCGKLKSFDKTKVYKIKDLKLKAVFRNRTISDQFVPEKIKELSGSFADKETSIITATDGELYGHHHQDFYNMTREAFSDSNIRSYKVSDFVHDFGQGELEEADPVMSSWGSTEEDVAAGIPFSYWKEPENAIQDKLWQFADFACQEVESSNRDENYEVARGFLDKGFSSCHFWAASGKKSMVWKNVIWNPDVIEKGNLFFMKAVRSLYRMDTEKRLCAERRFAEINQMIWKNHWEKFYHF